MASTIEGRKETGTCAVKAETTELKGFLPYQISYLGELLGGLNTILEFPYT